MHGMRAESSRGDVDHLIAALAAGQYGRVARVQLVALGIDRGAIARRLTAGRLHRIHAGVYAVGHTAPSREARWLSAVLACGEGAVLSHRSAASLWRIREGEGPAVDVSIPARGRRSHPGIAVHGAKLVAADKILHRNIPVTTPARTLVDLAHEVSHDDLVRALRETQFLRRFDLRATREALARRPCRTLRALLEDLALTQTRLEDRFLRLCDRHRIPRPLTQRPVLGRRVDFLWPRERVVVETDGWEAHGTRTAFQDDRTMSNALQLRGYTILRFTSTDLKRRPKRVADQIRAALAAGSNPAG
jgi:very-short-patch-repair endonuclease